MTAWRCAFCDRLHAIQAKRIPLHLHYSVFEGMLITDHFSDGSRRQRTIWGARIEGPVI
ncbi:hypothetical protein SEA_FIZZLES_18 [Microbacterium phage Fizzles]|nr:hypothetical protein SEA_FIZZLES_18 [Microbacterium phage Fizzles]